MERNNNKNSAVVKILRLLKKIGSNAKEELGEVIKYVEGESELTEEKLRGKLMGKISSILGNFFKEINSPININEVVVDIRLRCYPNKYFIDTPLFISTENERTQEVYRNYIKWLIETPGEKMCNHFLV